MQDTSPYQKVYYKGQEDETNSELVNSLKYRPADQERKRNWSPHITKQETLRKKRLREDEYTKNLEPAEKPILIIQSKQVYADPKNKDIINEVPREDEYFKVTKSSQVIEDVDAKLDETRSMKGRPTKVYRSASNERSDGEADPENEEPLNAIYKIQGIEFLPEGFLELDPMLFKDEYEFISEADQEMFKDDQRRIRVQRRKQYAQRNLPRKREVTIFVADELKDRLIEHFETFYTDHQRKLDQEELEKVAGAVGASVEEVAQLQELYLEKKKQANARRINRLIFGRYMDKAGNWHEMPDILKRFLNKEYPHGLQGEAQARAKRAAKKKVYATPDGDSTDSMGQSAQIGKEVSGQLNTMTQPLSTSKDTKKPLFFMYYDSQISNILDKIRGSKDAQAQAQHRPTFTPGLGSQEANAERLKKAIEADEERNMNEMDRLLKQYNLDPEFYRQRAMTELVNNRLNFKIEGQDGVAPNPRLTARGSAFKAHRGSVRESAASKPRGSYNLSRFSVEPKQVIKESSLSKNGSISFKGSVKQSVGFNRDTFGPSARASHTGGRGAEVKSLTVVTRDHNLFPKVTPKLAKLAPKIGYAYEIISDPFEKDGQRQYLITTLDQNAEPILMDEIAEQDADQLYHGFFDGTYDKDTYLIVLRDADGQILEVVRMNAEDEIDDAKLKYLTGESEAGVGVVVDQVVDLDGQDDMKNTRKSGKVYATPGVKPKSNTMSSSGRPKNISLMKPRAYTNISNIMGATKRSDAPAEGQDGEGEREGEGEGDGQAQQDESFGPGRQTSMSGKKSEAGNADWNQLGEDGNQTPGKKGSVAAQRVSAVDRKGSTSPIRSSQAGDGKKGSLIQSQKVSRLSADGRPIRVTEIYEGLKTDSLEELAKEMGEEEGQESDRRRSKSPSRVGGSINKKGSVIGDRPASKSKMSKIEVAEPQAGEEANGAEGENEEGGPSPRPSNVKQGSRMGSKISRVSKGGRPTNFSVFYNQYVDDALDEFGNEIPEEKRKTTAKPLSGSIIAKRTSEASTPKGSIIQGKQSIKGMPAKIKSILEAESNTRSQKELAQVESEIRSSYDPRLIDEFYQFCRDHLPDDARYKESILFVSLFYFFLEKKGLMT